MQKVGYFTNFPDSWHDSKFLYNWVVNHLLPKNCNYRSNFCRIALFIQERSYLRTNRPGV